MLNIKRKIFISICNTETGEARTLTYYFKGWKDLASLCEKIEIESLKNNKKWQIVEIGLSLLESQQQPADAYLQATF